MKTAETEVERGAVCGTDGFSLKYTEAFRVWTGSSGLWEKLSFKTGSSESSDGSSGGSSDVFKHVQLVLQKVVGGFCRCSGVEGSGCLLLTVLFVFYLLSPEFCSVTRHTSVCRFYTL